MNKLNTAVNTGMKRDMIGTRGKEPEKKSDLDLKEFGAEYKSLKKFKKAF